MQHGGKRAGAGRKPSSIALGELEKLCGLQCTDEDVAGFFGVKVRTIERRRQKEPASMMTAAAIDRLVHHSVIIELNIPSYRVEHAKKNQQAESQAAGE